MEIEKKYLVKTVPERLEQYEALQIEQGYLNTRPVLRIRKCGGDYILTYKSKVDKTIADPVCVNREVELPLTEEAYLHLREKTDGCIVEKVRYRIPYREHTIELDVFHGKYEGMVLAEVEFATQEQAEDFEAPDWFGENVSGDFHYSNAYLATGR